MLHIYYLNANDSLIIHSDNNKNIYILVEGIIVLNKIFTNKEELSICLLKAEYKINISFDHLYNPNYYYSIKALQASYLISISPEYQKYYSHTIIQRYSSQNNQIINLCEIKSHRNMKNRLIHFLILLSQYFGKNTSKYIEIYLHISFTTLASIIGTNSNTARKYITNLEADGIITYNKNKIIIHNLLDFYQNQLIS